MASTTSSAIKQASATNEEKITKYFSPKSKSHPTSENNDDRETKVLDISSPFLTPETTPTKGTKKPDDQTLKQAAKQLELGDKDVRCTKKVTSADEKEQESSSVVIVPSESQETKDETKKKSSKIGSKGQQKPEKPTSQQKPKSSRKKKAEHHNKLLTDYFPVRRSDRRSKTLQKQEEEKELQDAVLSGREDGLKVEDIEGKGRGVMATKKFRRGDFVVEYYGDLIDLGEAKLREEKYSKDSSVGCYMYYFNFRNKKYCIDATAENGRLGRLLNHSTKGNCMTKMIGIKDCPYLILVAAKDIDVGEELLYDYGDRSKDSLQSHPWLKL